MDALFDLLGVREDGGYFGRRGLFWRRNGSLNQRLLFSLFRTHDILIGSQPLFFHWFLSFFFVIHPRHLGLSVCHIFSQILVHLMCEIDLYR